MLNGHCNSPIAGHATLAGSEMTLRASVLDEAGAGFIEVTRNGPGDRPRELGRAVGMELLAKGAAEIIARTRPEEWRPPAAARTQPMSGEIAVPAPAAGEATGAGLGLAARDRRKPEAEFVQRGLVPAELPVLDGGEAVAAHRRLRQAAQIMGEAARFGERRAGRDHAVGEPDAAGLLAGDTASG